MDDVICSLERLYDVMKNVTLSCCIWWFMWIRETEEQKNISVIAADILVYDTKLTD